MIICRTVPQLIESVNDRLADLYALAQGEVLENVRLYIFQDFQRR
jgi:hypothetical protein